MLALPIYYPYDLMKTRMQTTQVKNHYNNLFDAFIKTYQEPLTDRGIQRGLLHDSVSRVRRFYTAMSLYGGTYITFVALEFSLYESVLRRLEFEFEGRGVFTRPIEILTQHLEQL